MDRSKLLITVSPKRLVVRLSRESFEPPRARFERILSVMSTDITESRVTSSRLVVCVNALGYSSGHWTRKHSGRSTGAGLGGMSVDADHREPFAAQRMQVTAAGRAASRSSPMGWPHRSQIPYVPVSSRCSAASAGW